jgi:hypothetical protein
MRRIGMAGDTAFVISDALIGRTCFGESVS